MQKLRLNLDLFHKIPLNKRNPFTELYYIKTYFYCLFLFFLEFYHDKTRKENLSGLLKKVIINAWFEFKELNLIFHFKTLLFNTYQMHFTKITFLSQNNTLPILLKNSIDFYTTSVETTL